jgi:hypothetical protein
VGALTQGEPLTFQKKIEYIRKAYFDAKEKSISNYFRLTGLLGDTPAEQVASRLLSEGIYSTPKFAELHEQQLDAYKSWNSMNNEQI